jgi:hypothetical protein
MAVVLKSYSNVFIVLASFIVVLLLNFTYNDKLDAVITNSAFVSRNNACLSSNFVRFVQCFVWPCENVYNTSSVLLWAPTTLPYRPRSGRRSVRTILLALLLLCAGDVELNPGPVRQNVNTGNQLTVDCRAAISVGCLNCRSAGNKIALIHDVIKNNKLDLLALNETWFTSSKYGNNLWSITGICSRTTIVFNLREWYRQ